MNIWRKAAVRLLLVASLAGVACWLPPAWSQQAPVVVQVPNGAAPATGQAGQKGETFFQTAGDVSLENGEGSITATLGDLLRSSDAAGLEKVRVTGRARGVSGAGTNIGQVIWTAVSVDAEGEKKTAPLASPLNSRFKVAGKAITAGTKIKAEGDLSAVITAARSLLQKSPKKAEKKDDKPAAKPAAASAPAATGAQGASNDIAKGYAPMQAPQQAPTTTPPPREPTLTLTSNGCSPRVDTQAGFVVIQSQTLADGEPSNQGCTDTAERIPIQKSYAGCPDLVQGDVAQPQYKQFWVATNGTTNFIGDCQPDPDTKYTVSSDTTGCQASANLSTLTWDVYAQRVYVNHDNQKVVVSACAISTSTALQVGKDYTACQAHVDLTTGLVSPGFKAWYVNPATKQQQNYTDCQPDTASAVAVQKDYAACPAVVGDTSAQRQYQYWYPDTTGKRVNVGGCVTDIDSSMVIQSTSQGCTDYVDQSQLKAWGQARSFYYDASGTAVSVKDCSPDPAQVYALQADYAACPVTVNEAAGSAEDVFQLFYTNATGRVNVGQCTPDPNRLYAIKNDYTSCSDKVDLPNLKAYAQFTTYYVDVAGVTHPVNKQCQPQTDAFQINTDTSVCMYGLDFTHQTAQEQGQLYYLDRLTARVMVRDCAPTARAPFPLSPNTAACSLRTDYTNMIATQQEQWQFTDLRGIVQNVTGCTDSTTTYPITAAYKVCPDLVLSDNSAAFKQIRFQIIGSAGPQYLTDCQPSQEAGDETAATTTVNGCETTFYHYISQGQSFGAWRYYYQFSDSQPVYLTSCEQSTAVYAIQSEIQGYEYNDSQKTAQPKTALYIMPPIGRVDVSAAQVRAGAANVAYTFEKTTYNARPGSNYWVGCEAYQVTDQTDTYLRPDQTEVSYLIGAGPAADLGNQCTYTTESQYVYTRTYISGQTYEHDRAQAFNSAGTEIWRNYPSGGPMDVMTYAEFFTSGPAVSGLSGGFPGSFTNYQILQQRTKVVYPNNGGTTYTSWANTGSEIVLSSGSMTVYCDNNGTYSC
jgi:hypothetical protein